MLTHAFFTASLRLAEIGRWEDVFHEHVLSVSWKTICPRFRFDVAEIVLRDPVCNTPS